VRAHARAGLTLLAISMVGAFQTQEALGMPSINRSQSPQALEETPPLSHGAMAERFFDVTGRRMFLQDGKTARARSGARLSRCWPSLFLCTAIPPTLSR